MVTSIQRARGRTRWPAAGPRFALTLGFIGLYMLLLAPPVGLTQPGPTATPPGATETIHHDLETLKAGQDAILRALQDLKKLLATPRGGDRAPIREIKATLHVAEGLTFGDTQATLTLVEFTDYQ